MRTQMKKLPQCYSFYCFSYNTSINIISLLSVVAQNKGEKSTMKSAKNGRTKRSHDKCINKHIKTRDMLGFCMFWVFTLSYCALK